MADRAEPVGDDEARPSGQQRSQRLLDADFGERVDRTGRFVENQDPRVGEHRPREADQLTLAQRQPAAALADLRRQSVGERLEHIETAEALYGQRDFFVRGEGATDTDVLKNRSGEQKVMLEHDSQLVMERLRNDVTRVLPVHEYAA